MSHVEIAGNFPNLTLCLGFIFKIKRKAHVTREPRILLCKQNWKLFFISRCFNYVIDGAIGCWQGEGPRKAHTRRRFHLEEKIKSLRALLQKWRELSPMQTVFIASKSLYDAKMENSFVTHSNEMQRSSEKNRRLVYSAFKGIFSAFFLAQAFE